MWLLRIIFLNKKSHIKTTACFFCRARGFHELTQIEIKLILARTLQGKGHLIAMYVQGEMDHSWN